MLYRNPKDFQIANNAESKAELEGQGYLEYDVMVTQQVIEPAAAEPLVATSSAQVKNEQLQAEVEQLNSKVAELEAALADAKSAQMSKDDVMAALDAAEIEYNARDTKAQLLALLNGE